MLFPGFCFSQGFPLFFQGFLCFSQGFPWFFQGFPWFSQGFLCFSQGFPLFFQCFPCFFQGFLCFSQGFPCFSQPLKRVWAPAPVQLLQPQATLRVLHRPLRPVRGVHVAARHALGRPVRRRGWKISKQNGWEGGSPMTWETTISILYIICI